MHVASYAFDHIFVLLEGSLCRIMACPMHGKAFNGMSPSPFKLMKLILQVMCLVVCIPSNDLCSLYLVACHNCMVPSTFHMAEMLC